MASDSRSTQPFFLLFITEYTQILHFTPEFMQYFNRLLRAIVILVSITHVSFGQGFLGYYQHPTLHGETLVFVAEGDLWTVPVTGGLARRLTSHAGEESYPHFSPDGQTLAFSATYEGPTELYTMPVTGGMPQRWTYEPEASFCATWTPGGEVVYATSHFSTLPDYQLVQLDPATKIKTRIPLSQATEPTFSADGKTLFFVRPADHRNVTKRYTGGTARQIWKFTEGAEEAVKLTTDHTGESHHPMWWNGRIYFITDRDGTMNLWSMTEAGDDLTQHTFHKDFDIRYATLNEGRIVYQRGADIWLWNIQSGAPNTIPITLATDLEQLRENWVKNPSNYITSVHLHPEGEQLVITARGRVFVVPVNHGRALQLSRKEGVRYRDATFMADGEHVLTLSDESGEFEFVNIPATGIGEHETLTNNGNVLRYAGLPSPDGKWILYDDLNQDLWLFNLADKSHKRIFSNRNYGIGQMTWSPDSRWVTFEQYADNSFAQIMLYEMASGSITPLTSDRANSYSLCWDPKGKWVYFLSDRNFQSLVGSPWGSRQPEPYFDRKMKVYQIALEKGTRSQFRPQDELFTESEEKENKPDEEGKEDELTIAIDLENIQERLQEVPLAPGNFQGLACSQKALYFMERETGLNAKSHLKALAISNEDPKPKTLVSEVSGFNLSANRKKLMIRKGKSIYVVDAGTSPISDLSKNQVDLKGWTFSIDVREDWKQLYVDAWRMERDYFYDPNMHGVDWEAMRDKYLPLVDRVATRNELSDVIGRMVGELSALHTSVRGGDMRRGDDNIRIASLGGRFTRDETAGGYRIDYIYKADPDYPHERSPLDHPELAIQEGDIIEHINGVSTLSVPDMGALLRNQAGKQIRIGIKSGSDGNSRDAIVVPVNSTYNLRYRDWEYSRRLQVEDMSADKIGYVHLRAMGSNDISQWYREFYPVFNRQGLIIDVRHNRGGNIESFILEKLLRTAWMYWKNRDTKPYWNMQYAFRGHIVVLVNERTASDGEAFADGFRRLDLGKIIGTRTWGGEIWLSSANRLSDNGLARAPMMGVYGPEGKWLIEQEGVVPDMEVDNLPHATFNGKDAQLEAAIQYLLEEIKRDPREVPEPPAFPDRSFENK